MSITSLRTPKEGNIASSDKWRKRGLSTVDPQVSVFDTGLQGRLSGISTSAIRIAASVHSAAVRVFIQESVGQAGINTAGIRIGAVVREMIVDYDYISPDSTLQTGINTDTVRIGARVRSLVKRGNISEHTFDVAPQVQGITYEDIQVRAIVRDALVVAGASEVTSQSAPQARGIDTSRIRVSVSVNTP